MADNEVRMMLSVLPGAMTGFAALNSGLVSINNVFGSMTRSIDAQFGLIDTAIMTTGVVVAQMGMDAMNAFGQFEQGMKIVQMVSGQTRADIDLLSQKANEFSVQYRVDIDQITEGLQTLGRAGLNSASEQAEVLENGLYTAKLEGRDLNGVLEELIQTTALLGGDLSSKQFGEQSSYVEDLMVATSMTAPITTHDVNETLKYSGGIAAAAGANIESEEGKRILEDYMGSIAAFAQKGVTGSIAGTALRAFFNKPATQDSSVTEALASINLKPEYLWEDDEETMKPVSEQIRIINDQMKELNISTMDQLQIWSKIVGGKMGQQMMKLESDDIKNLTKDIQAADSASSLAANSMKTYEANVKAIGESGALLQRNVGEKLVFIANPFLEIINKIIGFLNQDFMSWPLTIGVISFITLAGRKAMSVISGIKAELSTLVQGAKQGLTYYTQKQGIVRAGDNPVDNQKERYKAFLQAKDEYYGRKSPEEQGRYRIKTSDTSNKLTPQEFAKNSGKMIATQTVGELKKAGWSESEILMKGRFSNLSKTSFPDTGMNDKQFVDFIGRHHILTKEQQANAKNLISSTTSSRGPFDQIFGTKGNLNEDIRNQILKNKAATKELGWTLTEETSTVEQNAQTHGTAIAGYNKESTQLQALLNERQSQLQNKIIIEEEDVSVTNQSVNAARAHSNVLIEETKSADSVTTATRNAAAQTTTMATKVETEFAEMTAAVSASVSEMGTKLPNRMYPKSDLGDLRNVLYPKPMPGFNYNLGPLLWGDPYGVGKFPPTSSSFGNIPSPFGGTPQLDKLQQEWIKSGLYKAFGRNISEQQKAFYLAANRVPYFGNLSEEQQKVATTWMYHYPDKAYQGEKMPVYGPANEEGIRRAKDVRAGAGVGVGNVEATKDSIRRTQDAEKQVNAQRIAGLGNQARNATKALDDMQKAHLSMVQYGEAELKAHKEGLAAEEQILMARRQAADLASSREFSTEQDRQKFQEDRTKGNLITSRKDIDDIRRDAKQDYNKYQRSLGTDRDRQKFQEDRTKGNLITSRKEIDAIRKEAEKDIKRNTLSLPNTQRNPLDSGEVNRKIQQSMGEIRDRVNRLNQDVVTRVPTGAHPEENAAKTYMAYGFSPSVWEEHDKEKAKKQGEGFGAAFKQSFSDRINRDRSGSFLSFGKELGPNGMRSATKGLSGLANKALNLSDAFGGPLMIAIMAFSGIINYVKGLYEEYSQELQKAKESVKEAYGKREEAESKLKQLYREQNPDAEKEAADDYVLKQYGKMYDSLMENGNDFSDWIKRTSQKTDLTKKYEMDSEKDDGSMKEVEEEEKSEEEALKEAIRENNAALYEATAQLQLATNKLVTKMQDGMWGIDGESSALSDAFGQAQDTWLGLSEGSGSVENGFLKTASQKDENYAGDTELTGLMLEDFKDAKGDWEKGMKTIFGSDFKDFRSTMSPAAIKGMYSMGQFANSLGAGKNARLQSSMMNDRKSWQKLAKEMAKYERKTGKHAMNVQDTKNQRMENLIKKLQIDTHLTRAQVIAAAQLQQLQDMYQVAEQAFVPLMSSQAETANRLYSTTAEGIAPQTGTAAGGAVGTEQNSAAIASYLSVMAQNAAIEAAYNQDLIEGNTQAKSKEEYLQEAVGTHIEIKGVDEHGAQTIGGALGIAGDYYFGGDPEKQKRIAYGLEYQGDRIRNSEWTDQQVSEYSKRITKLIDEGMNFKDAMELARKNYAGAVAPQITAAYLASGAGEEEGESGGGSGSGGGSDSGDKNNNQGTRKERVDLVLCSKKEIPKLNVNLFKKPPTFTVLNKNFKVRDVKINTEDKPKAIMSAIKNSFIDVQKRSDPKIIQDEEGVYDPNEATDGNPLPSGSAKTKTD